MLTIQYVKANDCEGCSAPFNCRPLCLKLEHPKLGDTFKNVPYLFSMTWSRLWQKRHSLRTSTLKSLSLVGIFSNQDRVCTTFCCELDREKTMAGKPIVLTFGAKSPRFCLPTSLGPALSWSPMKQMFIHTFSCRDDKVADTQPRFGKWRDEEGEQGEEGKHRQQHLCLSNQN